MSQKNVDIVELPEYLCIVYFHLWKVFIRSYFGSFLRLLLLPKWNYLSPSEDKFSITEVIFSGFLLIYNCNYIKGIFLLGQNIFLILEINRRYNSGEIKFILQQDAGKYEFH